MVPKKLPKPSLASQYQSTRRAHSQKGINSNSIRHQARRLAQDLLPPRANISMHDAGSPFFCPGAKFYVNHRTGPLQAKRGPEEAVRRQYC